MLSLFCSYSVVLYSIVLPYQGPVKFNGLRYLGKMNELKGIQLCDSGRRHRMAVGRRTLREARSACLDITGCPQSRHKAEDSPAPTFIDEHRETEKWKVEGNGGSNSSGLGPRGS